MATNPIFRFEAHVAPKDAPVYDRTRWDEAIPIKVLAQDADEAIQKAAAAMGGSKYGWDVAIDAAVEVGQRGGTHADLAKRLRVASADKALSIGEAWGLLDEAADALEGVAREEQQ